jgi:hypothetical protein
MNTQNGNKTNSTRKKQHEFIYSIQTSESEKLTVIIGVYILLFNKTKKYLRKMTFNYFNGCCNNDGETQKKTKATLTRATDICMFVIKIK